MRKVELGRTGVMVSEICLGSMTWGTQNTEAEGHAQIDCALDRGVNFIDTAEVYPVNPISAETVGRTEEIIGTWFAKTGRRKDVVLATKIAGDGMKAVRDGGPITPASIRVAVEGSLKRLQTDHIDLYQFHWPNRGGYHFRQNWKFDPSKQPGKAEIEDNMTACLEALASLRGEGKIGHFGLSNDSAWGTMEFIRLAEAGHGPRVSAIQNEYSLMYRLYDTDLAELGVHEGVTLLAYSPLATGMLSGKYSGGAVPEGSRRAIVRELGGRSNPRAFEVADLYVALARDAGLDPVTMAIAWTLGRPFPIVPIIGATSIAQLEKSLDAAGMALDKALLAEIDRVHHAHPMPF
ncbi:aryl-alcohol dehydrogenase-like predicted oxidoreductase [Rhodobacter aestuarii]|uniref:Predicted oxidoreductase n=1 Tax=Rhodobacter aestuarii TaxID=453582 RepID=A0A1N7MNB0_9RHOB|nr:MULTISPECIES: aldo/keto reductase [Rhodobacter]PTV96655.1 aryl-alcohol dehydrogenase-like predicted oxidoreductase [Rhodobacter aestuarii]SIS87369.1 Predicted oxidoreductase [Rhodobacter aestuarii]SOB90992.1 aryl-alcohol dehydrogenase-like predicted oxidoreductase [Rhodobacter sp. JA431]